MSAWHLLDPQLGPLFETPSPDLGAEALPIMRQFMGAAKGSGPAMATDAVAIEEQWIESDNGQPLRLLIVRSRNVMGPVPAFVHFHPGGWVLGVPEMSLTTLIAIASKIACVIVSVDYRLAPEHPFPAAFEDGLAALGWLAGSAQSLGIDRDCIGLLGESAGGNIAAGIAVYLRDHKGPVAIAFQSLVYPALDDRAAFTEPHPFAGSIGLDKNAGKFAWQSLLGAAANTADVPAHAAPARAKTLAGLPPTFIAIGSLDPFIDENLDFAQRLIRDGVKTELYVIDGAPHGFDRAEDTHVTVTLRQTRNSWLKRSLNGLQH